MERFTEQELKILISQLRHDAEEYDGAVRADVCGGLNKLWKIRAEQMQGFADRLEKACTKGNKRIAIDR